MKRTMATQWRAGRGSLRWAGRALLGIFLLGGDLLAADVTLRQGLNGYTGTTDAWVDESGHGRNYGGSVQLDIRYDMNDGGFNEDHALLRFNLPSLTSGGVSAATLNLYYEYAGSMQNDNATGIRPWRVNAGKSWFENVYDGTDENQGVNWEYYDQYQVNTWTNQAGGWDDRTDDGNGTNKIKDDDGTPPDAVAPLNWVSFNVQPSVSQWNGGAANNGFLLYSSSFQGGGTAVYGRFTSRNSSDAAHRPTLAITYQNAHINWSGASSGAWDTTTDNWSVGGYLGRFGTGDSPTFADGPSNRTITVTGGGVTVGAMTVNSSADYAFSGGAINGPGGLSKTGSGTLALNAANGYSGITTVGSGRLSVSANNALGTAAAGTTVSSGAQLELSGGVAYSTAEALTLSGGGISNTGALYSSGGTSSWAGNVTLDGSAYIGVASGAGLTVTGAFDGGNLYKVGGGTLTLGGSSGNTYGGGTYVDSGTLVLAKSSGDAVHNSPLQIGTGSGAVTVRLDASNQIADAATVTVNSGSQLNLNGYNETIGALTLSNATVATGGGTLTLGGDVTSSSTSAISGGALDLYGFERTFTVTETLTVSASVTGGTSDLIKAGGGTLILTGDNSYAGETEVSAGAVRLGHSNALGSTAGGTVVSSGARLEMQAGAIPIEVGDEALILNGGGGGGGALCSLSGTDNRWAGDITLATHSTVGVDGGTLTLTGVLGGGGGMGKVGAGTLRLEGDASNTYAGATDVQLGTLVLANTAGNAVPGNLDIGNGDPGTTENVWLAGDEQVDDSATVTLQSDGWLYLDEFSETVGGIAGEGSVHLGTGGVLTVNGVADSVFDGRMAGKAGALHKQGPAVLTLTSPASDYAGGTWVGAGTLVAGNAAALGIGTVTVGGGRLIVAAGVTLGNDVVFSSGTVGGNGAFGAPLEIPAGGTAAPGDSIGLLTAEAGLGFGDGAVYEWEFDDGGADLLAVAGQLRMADSPATVIRTIRLGGSSLPPELTLFTFDELSGAGPDDRLGWTVTGALAGYQAQVAGDGRSIFLIPGGIIPEPATLALLALLAAFRPRRRG